MEHQSEIYADHVSIPLCALGRVVRQLQLIALWTPVSPTLGCVTKGRTACGLMRCPVKGDTPYFTAIQFWMLRGTV